MKEVNAKAFRAHRELRIMFAAWNLCVLCRLRPTLIAPKLLSSLSLWFNKPLIHCVTSEKLSKFYF